MAKALAEFILRRLDEHFYGTKRLRGDCVMQDTVLCQIYGTIGGIKQMGTHISSENVRPPH
jgi:hypothetical protein